MHKLNFRLGRQVGILSACHSMETQDAAASIGPNRPHPPPRRKSRDRHRIDQRDRPRRRPRACPGRHRCRYQRPRRAEGHRVRLRRA